MLVLPDGTALDRRALSKVRRGESGHEYVERRLTGFGVLMRRPGEYGGALLARALPAAGWSRCAMAAATATGSALGGTRAQRAAVRIALPAGAYPAAATPSSTFNAAPY